MESSIYETGNSFIIGIRWLVAGGAIVLSAIAFTFNWGVLLRAYLPPKWFPNRQGNVSMIFLMTIIAAIVGAQAMQHRIYSAAVILLAMLDPANWTMCLHIANTFIRRRAR